MAKKNNGKQFEQLVQEIYQAFLDYDSNDGRVQQTTVRHNVQLDGKCGSSHQIDVYWEFSVLDVVYKTIVEVKDWTTPVKQEQIRSFKGLLDDIPGNTHGIYVSKSGFQSGAVQFAKANDITLVQVSADSKTPIYTIAINNTTTHYENVLLDVDEEWIEFERCKSLLNQIVPMSGYEQNFFINPKGDCVNVFELMCMRAVPYYHAPDFTSNKVEIELEGDWYWESQDPRIPLVKIVKLSYECYNTSACTLLELKHKDFSNYIINYTLSGKKHNYNSFQKRFDKDI